MGICSFGDQLHGDLQLRGMAQLGHANNAQPFLSFFARVVFLIARVVFAQLRQRAWPLIARVASREGMAIIARHDAMRLLSSLIARVVLSIARVVFALASRDVMAIAARRDAMRLLSSPIARVVLSIARVVFALATLATLHVALMRCQDISLDPSLALFVYVPSQRQAQGLERVASANLWRHGYHSESLVRDACSDGRALRQSGMGGAPRRRDQALRGSRRRARPRAKMEEGASSCDQGAKISNAMKQWFKL